MGSDFGFRFDTAPSRLTAEGQIDRFRFDTAPSGLTAEGQIERQGLNHG